MTQPVDVSQPLASAAFAWTQYSHEQSSHVGRVGGYSCDHLGPLTKADPATAAVKYLACQPYKSTLSPYDDSILLINKPLGNKLIIPEPSHTGKGNASCLVEMIHILGMGLPLPPTVPQPAPLSTDSQHA